MCFTATCCLRLLCEEGRGFVNLAFVRGEGWKLLEGCWRLYSTLCQCVPVHAPTTSPLFDQAPIREAVASSKFKTWGFFLKAYNKKLSPLGAMQFGHLKAEWVIMGVLWKRSGSGYRWFGGENAKWWLSAALCIIIVCPAITGHLPSGHAWNSLKRMASN